MAAQLFAALVTFVIIGWLWFFIVRPIILAAYDWWESADVSSVSDDAAKAQHSIMSNAAPSEPPSAPSVSQTDGSQTDRQRSDGDTAAGDIKPEYLTLYKLLRANRISREAARPALKAAKIPLDNNLWRAAAPTPPPDDEERLVTPFAGRVTRRSYYPDRADLEYQPPEER